MSDALAPWNATLTLAEHSIIVYALSVAGLALFAFFVKSLVSTNEVTGRYRTGVYAGMAITGIAFLSYVLLVVEFALGYERKGDSWVPNANAILTWAPRYFDWTVTVPLLVIELLAVATLAGAAARRLRAVGIAAAFLMISTGFIGGVVIDSGTNEGALWLWGVISGVFMVVLYVLVIYVVVKGGRDLRGTEAAATLRNAGILLIVTWMAYPIVFGLQGWGHGGAVITWMQVVLSAADIVAKVGFGSMIHKIAKLRSAEDVRTGVDTLPEALWISSEKLSDGVLPGHEAAAGTAVSGRGERRVRR
ncbi:bacteriorhodopsin [Curtobacterium caseinilyticum]|uniref:Bacteriorhodopsin n=1 Tax=Curtobacterium caseinilyticum TaxID=3055137 RepID=A0ABT7TSU2_9MICO|nr:bacteriorhodopsin [Curtobacterium caseinilyticum]MDM7892677.1 bacteriorhodopsin [Curtobacterium caseinilyticum]